MSKTVNNKTPNICFTIKHDICTGCGICECACPQGAIEMIVKDAMFVPRVDETLCNNSKGCHRCYDACPGVGVNLVGMAKDLFKAEGTKEDKMVGRYIQCYTGFSNNHDIRWHSASGGMVSQLLIWLLEKGKIDGAVVTKYDNGNPLMVNTFIATTKEDVLDARSSKYGPVTMNHLADDLKKANGSRYVVVGLPCHIHGIRKLMALDKKLEDKIFGLFAIYCSGERTFHLTEHVMKERGIDRTKLRYFAYRDEGCLGSMVAITDEGGKTDNDGMRIHERNSETYLSTGEKKVFKDRYQNYYHPLRSFFIPRRCLLCIDHYGELADISLGDIHVKPYSDDKVGVNSLIARSQRWKELLEECADDGAITLDMIPFDIVSSSQAMSFRKKGRNGAFINLGKKMGWVMPLYDADYLRRPTFRDSVVYAQNRMQQFLGRHKALWWAVSLLKKDTSNLK